MYTLFSKYMNYSVKDDNWVNRDRFVMSAGHGSALLYATMFMAGYNISLEDLQNFRKLGEYKSSLDTGEDWSNHAFYVQGNYYEPVAAAWADCS